VPPRPPDIQIAPGLAANATERAALRRAADVLRTDSSPDEIVIDRPFYLYRKRAGDLNVVYVRVEVEGVATIRIMGFQSA
jgi:hypothetical protein